MSRPLAHCARILIPWEKIAICAFAACLMLAVDSMTCRKGNPVTIGTANISVFRIAERRGKIKVLTRTLALFCGYRMTMNLPIVRWFRLWVGARRIYAQILLPFVGPGCHFWRPKNAELHILLENIEARNGIAICNVAGYTVTFLAWCYCDAVNAAIVWNNRKYRCLGR